MAAATGEGGGAGEEADVVNPIVFFDITLGGEFLIKNLPNFSFPFHFAPGPPLPLLLSEGEVCVFCLFK